VGEYKCVLGTSPTNSMSRILLEKPLSERHGLGTARVRQRRGIACVNQTRPHCAYQMGKTQSKPLAARHDRAGERHGICELAFRDLVDPGP
jgi:hypothetical protein